MGAARFETWEEITPLEQAHCDLCGSDQRVSLPELSRLTGVVPPATMVCCKECGLVYREPLTVEEQYDEVYYAEYMEKSNMVGGNEDISPALENRLAYLRQLHPQRGRLLEVGCAMGHFLNRARSDGWMVEGVEVSQWSSEHARRCYGLNVHTGTLSTVPLPTATYDVVHMNHVLEHLPSPRHALETIHRLLKPGGHLVIEVPNEFADLFTCVRKVIGRPPEPYVVPSPHLYIFRPDTLRKIIGATGFQVERLRTYRSDKQFDTRIPLGGLVKACVYSAEEALKRGPLIELVAVKA